MARLDFGPFRPDVEGVDRNILVNVTNVAPAQGGFRPVGSLAPSSDALPDTCLGSVSFLDNSGSGITIAGTELGLFKQEADKTWTNISKGGGYTTASGERWAFAQFGDLAIATNFADPPQKLDLTNPSAIFEDLGGSPPVAKYVTVVGSFLQFGNIIEGATLFPRRVQWSGLNNAEEWVPGVNSSGRQDFLDGGPINGMVGGDVGYTFQTQGIQRQIFLPASALIFQFDKIETDRGLLAPGSLIHIAKKVYFLDRTGFYMFDPRTNMSTTIGVDKVDRFFNSDKRANTDSLIQSAFDPVNHYVFWSYVSKDNSGITPDRILIYNWETKEFGKINVKAHAFVQFITARVGMDGPDGLDQFGQMDGPNKLAFSLDSSFWSGGNIILGVFGTDNKLSNLTGPFLEAKFETPDTQLVPGSRAYISGITPVIDANEMFAQIGSRERLGDTLTFTGEEAMESTGQIPIVASGRYLRARIRIPSGVSWFLAQGVDPILAADGSR